MTDRDFPHSNPEDSTPAPPFRVPDGAPEGSLARGDYRPDDEASASDDEASASDAADDLAADASSDEAEEAFDERPFEGPSDEMARFDAVSGQDLSDGSEWEMPSPYHEDTTDYSNFDKAHHVAIAEDWPENAHQSTLEAEAHDDIALPHHLDALDDTLATTTSASMVSASDHVPSPYDENAPEKDRELELVEHLGELRTRMLWCVGAIMVAMIGTWNYTPSIQEIIIRPVKQILKQYSIGGAITTTEPTEAFLVFFNISLISALIVVMPFLLFQMWRFVEPAMTKRERRFTGILVPFSALLFFLGCALGYAVSPLFFTFFAQFQPPGTLAMYSFASVAVLLAKMLLVFGICFQVPVITIFLNKTGVVSRNVLIEYWRHVVVVIFTVVAILTPTWDPVTLVVCATPSCLLYVLSIWLVKWL